MKRQTVYVCGACGKTARIRYDFKDVSCAVNSVLCYEDSLVYKEGSVIKADAVKKASKDNL